MSGHGPRLPAGLLALTPGDLDAAGARAFVPRAAAAVKAGLAALLVRERLLSDRAALELAQRLRDVLGPAGWIGVHDRVHVALAAGADGAHLGFRSLPIAAARRALGSDLALGFSAHAGDEPARWEGADYLVFGPVRATPSKAGLLEPTGFAGLASACARARVPVFAIGGLEPADGPAVLAAGARGACVLRGVFGAADPGAAVRAYLAAWGTPQGC